MFSPRDSASTYALAASFFIHSRMICHIIFKNFHAGLLKPLLLRWTTSALCTRGVIGH